MSQSKKNKENIEEAITVEYNESEVVKLLTLQNIVTIVALLGGLPFVFITIMNLGNAVYYVNLGFEYVSETSPFNRIVVLCVLWAMGIIFIARGIYSSQKIIYKLLWEYILILVLSIAGMFLCFRLCTIILKPDRSMSLVISLLICYISISVYILLRSYVKNTKKSRI